MSFSYATSETGTTRLVVGYLIFRVPSIQPDNLDRHLSFSGDLCQEKYDRKKFYVAEEVYPGESPSVFQCYLAETCDASKLIPDQLVGKENMRKQCGFHSRMPKHFPVIPDPSKTKQVGRHQEVYKLWLGSIYHD